MILPDAGEMMKLERRGYTVTILQICGIISGDTTDILDGAGLDLIEALVTSKQSGVVTRAAEPRTTPHGDRIDGFPASLLWIYCPHCSLRPALDAATAVMWMRVPALAIQNSSNG